MLPCLICRKPCTRSYCSDRCSLRAVWDVFHPYPGKLQPVWIEPDPVEGVRGGWKCPGDPEDCPNYYKPVALGWK